MLKTTLWKKKVDNVKYLKTNSRILLNIRKIKREKQNTEKRI